MLTGINVVLFAALAVNVTLYLLRRKTRVISTRLTGPSHETSPPDNAAPAA